MVGGIPPYRAKKVMYYQDERFRERAWLPAPESEEEQAAELFKGRTQGNDWCTGDDQETGFKGDDSEHPPQSDSLGDATGGKGYETGQEEQEREKELEKDAIELVLEEKVLSETEQKAMLASSKEGAEVKQNQQLLQEKIRKVQERNRSIELLRSPGGGDLPL